MTRPALIVIDLQNDYFADGGFPLWQAEEVLEVTERAIAVARGRDVPVVLVQHVADTRQGPAPFFNPGTRGVQIHPRIEAAAGDAPRVVKHFADAFEQTSLQQTLTGLNVDELILCGMMTQNCVTHTALSRRADDYRQTTVLTDATTTVSQILHLIALNGLSTRVRLANSAEALA